MPADRDYSSGCENTSRVEVSSRGERLGGTQGSGVCVFQVELRPRGARETIIDRGGPYVVQELCESRGGRPGLSVLTSLLVSVDVKLY